MAYLLGYFDSVADKLEDISRVGGKALVHCVAGVSRSASLCIAYLMKYQVKKKHFYIIQGVFFKSAPLKFLITPSIFNLLSF